MPSPKSLGDNERNIFRLVTEFGFTNPFSDKRRIIELKMIADHSPEPGKPPIDSVIKVISHSLNALNARNIHSLNDLTGKDRQLFEHALIFHFFYQYRKLFDRYIQDQLQPEAKPLKLPFFIEGRDFLLQRGFSLPHIQKTFEESYQLRRAFYFITRFIVGQSPVMKKLRYDVWNNIFTHDLNLYRKFLWNRMEDFSTLILGETGAGKGAVAAAIGHSGYIPFDMKKQKFAESFTTSFISVNLSQFPETLIESELFGHQKGSFTGAIDNYDGVFKRCNAHGIILLDEIGELASPIQVKLLQVLQERKFYPVGSTKMEHFYGRVMAATNRPIHVLREKQLFRDDFYYRLCSDIIKVPTLKERIQGNNEELTLLLSHIIRTLIGEDSHELVEMVRRVIIDKLGRDYPWHGNVRELEQCVRRVLLKKEYEGDALNHPTDLPTDLKNRMDQGRISAAKLVSGYCKMLYHRLGTFEEVSRRTRLDRRTVTKYIKEWDKHSTESISESIK